MMKTVSSSLKDKSIKVTAFPDLVILITQSVPGICKSTSEISWYIHEEMGQRRYCVHPRQRMIRRFKIHPSFPWLQNRRNIPTDNTLGVFRIQETTSSIFRSRVDQKLMWDVEQWAFIG